MEVILQELSSYQKSNVPGLFTKVSGGIYSMTMMCTTKEKCVEFEDIKKYITALNERLTTFEKIMCRMYKEKRGNRSVFLSPKKYHTTLIFKRNTCCFPICLNNCARKHNTCHLICLIIQWEINTRVYLRQLF